MAKSPNYLTEEDVPEAGKDSLLLDTQRCERTASGAFQLYITRRCLECSNETRVTVTSVRSYRHRFTGLCKICSARAKFKKNGKDHPSWKGGVTLRNCTLRSMKASAQARGHEWLLSESEAFKLMESNCFYCNSKPSNVRRDPSYKGVTNKEYCYNGIDRINNNKGYIKSNVVPCCWKCNNAKAGMTLEDFLDHIEKIYLNSDSIIESLLETRKAYAAHIDKLNKRIKTLESQINA